LYILVIKQTNGFIGLWGVTAKYLELTSIFQHFVWKYTVDKIYFQ